MRGTSVLVGLVKDKDRGLLQMSTYPYLDVSLRGGSEMLVPPR